MNPIKRATKLVLQLLSPVLFYELIRIMSSIFVYQSRGDMLENPDTAIHFILPGILAAIILLSLWYRRECTKDSYWGMREQSENNMDNNCYKTFDEKQSISMRAIFLISLTAVCCSVFFNFFLSLFYWLDVTFEETAQILYKPVFWQQLLYLVILMPLAEELVFRGLGYYRLRRELPPLHAALISSLFFALYHGNLKQGIYAFFVGLVLVLLYEIYDSLLMPYLFHVMANLASTVMQNMNWNVSYIHHRKMYLIVLFISGILLFWGLYKIREDEKNHEITVHSHTVL